MELVANPESLCFICNICGERSQVAMDQLQREVSSCQTCLSSPRYRAIIRALSLELFNQNLILPDFPLRPDISGLGMTDWDGYATRLAAKLNYRNTYYHREPKLDISAPELPQDLIHSSNFLISSEIFEHVVPPVQKAFANSFKLLKPGGVLVLTVPYGIQAETVEHFPELNDFAIRLENDSYYLENITQLGRKQRFDNLIFHGGPGSTLEMRIFAETALIQHLTEAGFEAVTVHRTPDLSHGIWWPEPWSLPLTARRPKSDL
jgi:hypothetical protein